MKNILVSTMLAVFLLCSCGTSMKDMEASYTIRVTGTEALKFSGHYSFAGTDGIPRPVNIDAVVPMEYKGKGMAAVCLFRKKTADGTLKVDILKDDKVVSTSETTQPFGVVSQGKVPDTNSIVNKILGAVLG